MANEPLLRRPNYFPGELLTTGDYEAEQDYVDALRRAHDFKLHTWGVAVGLDAELESGMVTVSPGIAFAVDEHILIVSEEWSAPAPTYDAYLVVKSERTTVPLEGTRLPRTREDVEFSWPTPDEIDKDKDLILAEVIQTPSSPILSTRGRRHVSMSVGALRFAHGLLSSNREPTIVGWSAGSLKDATSGLRVSADEVRFLPRSGSAPDARLSAKGPVAIGTMSHRAALEVRAPNAPLPGPGKISSSGTTVRATASNKTARSGEAIPIPINRIVAPGDRIFTQNLAGNRVQADVESVGADNIVSTSKELNAEDATWTFQRRHVARFASESGAALLVCNVCDSEPRVGLGTANPEERFAVSGGDVRLTGSGAKVVFGGNGRIMTTGPSRQEIRFEQDGHGVELRTAKAMELKAQPPTSSYSNKLAELHLTENGNVGIGEKHPEKKLVVEGAIRASKGFIFPDGTEQKEAEIAVPIGGIIDWWRPNAQREIPPGYAICDGARVTAPGSPFVEKTLPNLTGYFIRGAWDETQISDQGKDGTTHYHMFSAPAHQHFFEHSHASSTVVEPGADKAGQSAGKPPGRGASCDHEHKHKGIARVEQVDNVKTGPSTEIGSSVSYHYQTDPETITPPYVGLLKLMRIQ